jgi:tRNA threonylcarbamoyl adenosine modification protein YjeE
MSASYTASASPAQGADAVELDLEDEAATERLAARLARCARPGDVIALAGPLGAGKTAFARAFIQALSKAAGGAARRMDDEVPSPTFTLVQSYRTGAMTIHHFDLFRLRRPDDLWELGFEEALGDGVSLIEWPERATGLLPVRQRLDVILSPGDGETRRHVRIAGDESWRARLAEADLARP